MLVDLGKVAILFAVALIAMRAFFFFREWRDRRAALARIDAIAAKARDELEFVAEIPDGASVRFMGNGNVLIAHPDHPPKIIRSDGRIEEVKPCAGS